MLAVTLASFLLTGLRVDLLSRPLLFLPVGVLLPTRWFYSAMRPRERMQVFAETCLQVLLVLLLGTLLSYAAATSPLPFQDDNLNAIDNTLGLDRRAYIGFFNDRSWLFAPVKLAYFALMSQFALVLPVLFLANQPHCLQQFTFAVGAAPFATDVISVFTPSVTTIYLDHGLPVHAALPPSAYTPVPTLEALRSGLPYLIHLDTVEGLISFPSFHTVGALLVAWTLRTVCYIRWIAFAVNAALIAATPIVGAHYFIDLAGGAVVAAGAIVTARWLSYRAVAARLPAFILMPDLSAADLASQPYRGLQPLPARSEHNS